MAAKKGSTKSTSAKTAKSTQTKTAKKARKSTTKKTTTKTSSKKSKAAKKTSVQSEPAEAHLGKETIPEFVDVEEKNLRNGFGMSHTTDFDKRLAEINKRLEHHAKKHTVHHTHRPKRKIHKPHFFKTVLITTLLVILVIALGALWSERTVVDGQCSVRIVTYSDGVEEVQFTPLPGTSCSSVQDCRDVLHDRNFPEEEISRMEIRCS